ncbi:hypothetical protein GTA62_14020 [Roseobacter sp. HKCCD9010]|jgi:hypothetical protein|uniref:hypothetical protein n=1 Tax=unclassified Roseobacter TaxID=196798 RepID=UPI00119B9FA8|nr:MULTISPECIES: hypothetical protein [unclassified Roseobacter]MBF9050771.1 hypothetical protein [Rhodobacterales bacterium HKCCD4356]NNV11811.1 hypothetical protein [Roseobacter sp. HKCCD7357]NNV17962.1 hypothetical protein [Roseobacter sp. HKCCD8768]NNV26053.1 hypothetical protein [Roseobacter sp. HKCCD8192]NNV31689.1 hypothetical protein [Roseobacter sp. HKCCD9061]
MDRLKLFAFALRQMSRMGYNMAGAEFSGGEIRRQRAMAHKRLYFQAMDAATPLHQPWND